MATEITVNNETVLKNLKEFADTTFRNNLEKALTQVCLKVEADAKKKCPVADGTLRQSIQYSVEIDGDSMKGVIGSNLEHAPYIHHGTGIYAKDGNGRKQVPWKYKDAKGEWHSTEGIKPTPFLQDAVDSNRSEILSFFKGVLGE